MKSTKSFSLVIAIALIFVLSCNGGKKEKEKNEETSDTLAMQETAKAEEQESAPEVEEIWSSPSDFKIPESVIYDQDNDVLYVANINGNPSEKDGNGFLSKLSMQGEILSPEWITGLHAPKGMGIFGESLFVTDIDKVVEINIAESSIINEYPVGGAQFLNDIDIDQNTGNVYISDMGTGKIHMISEGEIDVWLEDDELQSPNGLFVEGDFLLIGAQKVFKVDLETTEKELFIDNTGSIDGLEAVGNGWYVNSDWQGTTQLIHPEKQKIELLNFNDKKVNSADIEFIPDKMMLLIPTFYDNRVVAYKLKL
jgi:DNA-binding beta-propeller fold protein YncE